MFYCSLRVEFQDIMKDVRLIVIVSFKKMDFWQQVCCKTISNNFKVFDYFQVLDYSDKITSHQMIKR